MKLIIDIPDEDYNECKFRVKYLKDLLPLDEEPTDLTFNMRMETLIANGVELPKEHGRLGDLDILKKEMHSYLNDCAKTSEYTRLGFETAIAVVEDAGTIIEANKENKE